MRPAALAAAAFLTLATAASAGDLTVGTGVTVDLGGAFLDTGEGDIHVEGTLSAGTEGFDARHVSIETGGVLNGDTALIQVCGDWSNAGTFNPGVGGVSFVDGCGLTSAVITGDTTFNSFELLTTTGKLYLFEAGSTQTVTTNLFLGGDSGNLLTLRSTLDGSAAFLDNQAVAPNMPGFAEVKNGQRRD